MLKKDFINVMQSKLGGYTKKECEKAIDAFTEAIEEVLINGDEVKLTNFGTFKLKVINAHDGINPQTHKTVHYETKATPYLKFAQRIKQNVTLNTPKVSD